MPVDGSAAGEAYTSEEPTLSSFWPDTSSDKMYPDERHQWLASFRWHGQQWALHVPYRGTRSRDKIVLLIDGSAIPITQEEIRDELFSALAREAETMLKDKLPKEIFDADETDQEPRSG